MKPVFSYIFAAFTLAVLGFISLNEASIPDALDLIDSTLLFFFSTYLIFVVISQIYNNEAASPLSLFIFTAFLHFGLAGLLYKPADIFVNIGNSYFYREAIIFTFLFMLCFHLTYVYIVRPRRHSCRSHLASLQTHYEWRDSRTFLVVASLSVIGLFDRLIILESGLYLQVTTGLVEQGDIPYIGTLRQLERFPDFAAWIATVHYFNAYSNIRHKPGNYFWKWLFICMTLFALVYWIPTGKKQNIIEVVAMPFLISYLTNGALPRWRYVAMASIFVAFLFPLSHMYRITQQSYLTGRTTNLTLAEIFDAVTTSATQADSASEAGAGGKTFGRLNQLEPVAASIRVIEDGALRLGLGRDYFNTAINLVPGFLWANKPKVYYGNEIAVVFGMLGSEDMSTSISVTLPAEAYLNFGVFGAFLVGPLIAFIYGGLFNVFGSMRSIETGRMLYLIVIQVILYVGASFALYMSALIQTLVFMFILCRFMEVRLPYSGMLQSKGLESHRIFSL